MQTFSLSKEELQDLNMHQYLFNRYIVSVVCKRIGIDLTKGTVKYDLKKGELTYEDNKPADKQPESQDKPSEGGDKPAA